jgi:L-fuculose-phosphate aldolase
LNLSSVSGLLRRVSASDDDRERVAGAARRLAAGGLVIGTGGNVSLRSGDRVAITATGARLDTIGPDEVCVVDLAGAVIDDGPAPSSELFLHLGIYERYGAGAVAHIHSPAATALSCVLDELPCVHYQMLLLGGAVRVAPYRTFGTPELAEATLEAMEGRAAALMANHGATVFAHDLDHAVENALLLEWACDVYWRAAQIGEPRILGEAELRAVLEAAAARHYGLTPEEPDA